MYKSQVYYFPDGAACTKSEKPTAYMAAYILTVNPLSKMLPASRKRGEEYVNRGFALEDRRPGAAETSATTGSTGAASSSSAAAKAAMPPPKAVPAVKKRPAGAR